jgi:DNA invertase Pin-like site-specific DNA recombinase
MLGTLKEGDTVHITETSRFARNYIAAMEMLDEMIFEKRVNVHIVSCSMMLEAGEKLDPYRWYTISQLLLTDELQRRIIGMNTKNGLAAKKEAGKKLGRPNAIDADIVSMMQDDRENGMKISDIAQKHGVSSALVSKTLRCREV